MNACRQQARESGEAQSCIGGWRSGHAIVVLCAHLEVCDPERNRWRSYRVEAGRDLLGDSLVEVRFGRIGARGRTVRYVADDKVGA